MNKRHIVRLVLNWGFVGVLCVPAYILGRLIMYEWPGGISNTIASNVFIVVDASINYLVVRAWTRYVDSRLRNA